MNKRVLFISLLFFYSIAASLGQATLKGQILNQVAGIPVSYIPPLHGTFFLTNYRETKPDATGNFEILISEIDTASIVSFYCNNAFWRLYTKPGDSDSIFVDLKTPKEIQFFGSNATFNTFLNKELRREKYFSGFADTPTEKEFLNDLHGERIATRITQMRDRELALLDTFRTKNPIDSGLYRSVANDIKYYHLSLFTGLTLSMYKPMLKASDIITPFDKAWGKAWERMMEHTEPLVNADALATYWYHDYIDRYIDWYRGSYLKEANLKGLDNKKGEYAFEIEQLMRKSLSGVALEVGLADLIYEQASQDVMQPTLISIHKRFLESFPKSIYTTNLAKAMKPILGSWNNDNSNLLSNTSQVDLIMQSDRIHTLDSLLLPYRGKVVYIDFWATWCGPCKQEFQYKDELEAFAENKTLQKLYVSIDVADKEQQWLDVISFFSLNGKHIRANDKLLNDLRQNHSSDGKGTLSLPRYMIVDKEGNIVIKSALRPSDRDKLYAQLDAVLNN